MQVIECPFNMEDHSQLENLTAVAGYIRNKAFDIETYEPGSIPEEVLVYIHALQEENQLSSEADMSAAVVDLLNELLLHKKYQDPIYIRVLHDWLRPLRYELPLAEYQNKKYGNGTTNVVSSFQKTQGLSVTGKIDLSTEQTLQQAYANLAYVVKGKVHDENWEGISDASIEVWTKTFRGTGVLLQSGVTHTTGEYTLSYHPPTDVETGLFIEEVHLLVSIKDKEGNLLLEEDIYHAAPVTWVNYTAGNRPYQGKPIYIALQAQLVPYLEGTALLQIEESDQHQDVTYLYQKTGVPIQTILQFYFAERVSSELEGISAAVLFAFFRQQLPSILPSSLLPDEPQEWNEWSETLTQTLVDAVPLMPLQLQERALEQAIQNNFIPLEEQQNKVVILQRLEELRLEYAQTKLLIAGRLSLNDLLKETGISAAKKTSIATQFANKQQLNPTILEEWHKEGLINEEEHGKIQEEWHLAVLSLYDKNVIQNLRTGYNKEEFSATISQASDFAKWTSQDWENLGYDPDDATGDFVQRAAALAPTVAAIAALQRHGEHGLKHLQELATLVDNQQLLSLGAVSIDTYLQEKNLELPQTTVNELKLIQRVEHLAPRPDLAPILLGSNIHSAYQVHRTGKTQLVEIYRQAGLEEALAKASANHTFVTASNTLSTLTGISASYGLLDGGGITPAAVTPLPNLEDLFGNNDFCGCVHCRSVYSPAAYLTDLLHWLENKPSKITNKNALDVLLERRPDLEHILLNCKNANTPMPYIDLVCEVLEYVIQPTPAYEKRNTTWLESELKAHSEYRLDTVYEQLAQLPNHPAYRPYASYDGFNIWQAQVHLFIEKLGISSSQFVQLLKHPGLGYLEQGAAVFELPSHEAIAITTPYADVDQLSTPSRNVATLLHDHQLSYEQLLLLLEGAYTNPNQVLSIEPEDSCDLEALLITNMTAVELDRWWRFLRLWKYTNWTMRELNNLLVHPKVGNGTLNTFTLERLSTFQRLQKRLGKSVDEVLGMMGSLDNKAYYNSNGDLVPSFYEVVFSHRLLEESQRDFFDKNNLSLSLDLGTITSEQIAYIGAALSMTSSQIETLLSFPQQGQWAQLLPQRVHQMASTAEGLGLLYAYATLAQYLNVSVEELKGYFRLLINSANPFVSLDQFHDFLDHYETLQASNLGLDERLFLLSGKELEGYQPSEVQVYEWQAALFEELGATYDNVMISKQTEAEVLQDLLSKTETFDTRELIETFLEVLYQTPNGRFTSQWSSTDRTDYLTTELGVLFAYADAAAVDQLKNELDSTTGSINAAVATLKVILHRRLHSTVVINHLADLWDAPTDVLAYLLGDNHPTLGQAARHRLMEASPTGSTTAHPMITVPTGPSLPNTTPSSLDFTTLYRRLLKYVFWAKAWQLNGKDLEQLELAVGTLPVLNLATLPLFNTTAAALYTTIPQVTEYLNTTQWVRFAKQHNIPVANLVEAILTLNTTNAVNDFLETIAEWTGWNPDDLIALHQHFQWTANSYTNELGHWEHWRQAVQLIQQLQVSAPEVLGWLSLYDTTNSNYFAQQKLIAQQVQNAVREAATPEQWSIFQQEIQDQIRLQKRNALVAYARNYDAQGNRVYYSTNDLYHIHLIDPQMSACQLTSRIKQAISAVQLYVQRCRLGLEQDQIQVNEEYGWSEWKWMQYYRVWEANRKVFLYPENWIEPSLRDNKSELFKQFEEEILQQEVTQENVELALENYLVQLNEISNLEIMSIARGFEQGSAVTHVLARTKEHPAVYYYRKIDDRSMEWTGWKKLSFEVQGEHPVLQVYQNKLHLFWLQIVEQPEEIIVTHEKVGVGLPHSNGIYPTSSTSSNGGVKSNTVKNNRFHKEVKLAWSTLHEGGWSTQKLSKRKLIHPWPHPNHSILLRPRPKQDDLWMDVYVSRSVEFNSTYYYNQFTNEYELLSGDSFDKAAPAVHYGSFVFDGFVRKIKAREIRGTYWYPILRGAPIYNSITQLAATGPVWLDDIQASIGTPTQYTVVTNYGSFNLSNVNDTNNLLGKLHGNAISLQEEQTFVNLWVVSNNNNTPVISIEYYTEDYHGTLTYQTVTGTFQSINNYLQNNSINHINGAVRPEETIQQFAGYSTSNATLSQEYIRHNNASSIDYIHNTFGEDGQHLEKLSVAEVTVDLEKPNNLQFRHNLLTTGNPSQQDLLLQDNGNTIAHPFNTAKNPFQVVLPMGYTSGDTRWGNHLAFQDHFRSIYLHKSGNTHLGYRLYHPHARTLLQTLGSTGVEGFYTRATQQQEGIDLATVYTAANMHLEDSIEDINFKYSDGYGLYNWELFFHVPFLIATELSKTQRFEEAMAWFHCVFNPLGIDDSLNTAASDVSRYWITQPFYEHSQSNYLVQQIQNLLSGLLPKTTQQAIEKWKDHPFQPHVIARMRPVAYQKAIVMKYIDNLLAWGDQLFRQDTLESINQASLMYVLAAELLGERPKELKGKTPTELDYNTIKADLDHYFSNTALDENLVISTSQSGLFIPGDENPVQLYSLPNNAQYFCIPHNEKLLGYWDTVADRLFKIRHCQNIDGRVRQLPLFAPPIDPALLVNAQANGVDISSVVQNISAFPPHYKYRPLVRLATQFSAEVKSLGQRLLSALQSKDAEGMALLQVGNAMNVLNATTGLKQLQIEEAQAHILSLEAARTAAIFRQDFYANRAYMNAGEKTAQTLIGTSLGLDTVSMATQLIGSFLAGIPKVEGGALGPVPFVKTEIIDGTKLANTLSIISTATAQASGLVSKTASIVGTQANYDRRQEEWDFQAELAEQDIKQIEQQIAAAQIRVALAEKDLKTHQLQIDNTETELAYLQSKYTNQQLYSWMVGQLSTIYRQAYDLAFDLAKRAEQSLNYELGLPLATPLMIQNGYWDSLRKGLLAGDKLMLSINQLEDKYVQLNKRELELTKHISLHQWAPDALLQLKTTGKCQLHIPEWWFDIDYPGHYLRRIKALTISIPCIVGPNTNVNCTVTLSRHSLRRESLVKGAGYTDVLNLDERYDSYNIATSSGQNDAGVFELNFNAERFLPFEGLGAISTWELSLPEYAQFDYKSITDVVMHLRYTARDGGTQLAKAAKTNLLTNLTNAASQEPPSILVSARTAFPTAWYEFKNPATGDPHALVLDIKQQHYPYFTSVLGAPTIVGGMVGVVQKENSAQNTVDVVVSATTLSNQPASIVINTETRYGAQDLGALNEVGTGSWAITANTLVDAEAIEDIYLLLVYKLPAPPA
ncbi:MAG: neuraminidase-like domain-containing protein [Aureispira sp.]